MNAKERLRAYLEQRRELGESEMVLDALDVDDVMRMLGALQGGGAAASTPPATGVSSPPPQQQQPTPHDAPSPRASSQSDTSASQPAPARIDRSREADVPIVESEPGADWREMMKTLAGASTGRPAAAPTPPPQESSVSEPAVERKVGTLRVEGVVFPLGLRAERPALLGAAAGTEWHSLGQVTAAIAACKACGLAATATRPVPGVGNPIADVMVVGEAPGEKEDLTGEPFVGPAGELLTKILGAIQLDRQSVYICNVLKHRPPGNRNPMPDEVRACAPFLQRQVDLVQPKIIIALGTYAAQSLLGTKLAIGKLRQQLHWYQGIPLVATYHPAALLRNEAWKRPTWEDIKLARRILDATIRA